MAPWSTSAATIVRPRHRDILFRLDSTLRAIRTDPSLRRRLRTDASSALAERGFCSDDVPAALPTPRQADPLITHGQLFGLVAAPRPAESTLELRLLDYGLKPLVLIHGQESELAALVAWAELRGYTALLSADEWDRQTDEGKGGYSNLAMNMRRARAGSGAWRSLLLGVDEDRTLLAWFALAFGWDEMLGRLLGYPACCTAVFAERWKEAAASHQGDVVAACIADSGAGPHDWRVNILGRYFGAEFLQHFPCRFGCASSIALASRTEGALAVWEPALHAWMRSVLAAPVVYTETSGIAILVEGRTHDGATGPEVTYKPGCVMVTEPNGRLDLALRSATLVKHAAPDGMITVAGRQLEGSLVGFADVSNPKA